jgi:DMSO reductase anchor subunit
MLKEWPLVAFTVAGQTALGLFLVAGLPLFFSKGGAADAPARGSRLAVLLTALGLMAAASFVSFFHLHHPFRAVRVLANVRASWLSREVLFELGFMALLAVLAFLLWTGTGGEGLHRGLFAAAGVSGVLFVWSMSKLYMLKAVPAWDHAYTPVSFFLTAVLLGALTAAAFSGAFRPGGSSALKPLLAACLVLVAAAFLWALLTAPVHGIFGARPPASLTPPGGASSALYAARLIMLVLGSLALAAAIWRESSAPALGAKAGLAAPVGLAWVLVLIGEVLGRFHFYGQVGRPGP